MNSKRILAVFMIALLVITILPLDAESIRPTGRTVNVNGSAVPDAYIVVTSHSTKYGLEIDKSSGQSNSNGDFDLTHLISGEWYRTVAVKGRSRGEKWTTTSNVGEVVMHTGIFREIIKARMIKRQATWRVIERDTLRDNVTTTEVDDYSADFISIDLPYRLYVDGIFNSTSPTYINSNLYSLELGYKRLKMTIEDEDFVIYTSATSHKILISIVRTSDTEVSINLYLDDILRVSEIVTTETTLVQTTMITNPASSFDIETFYLANELPGIEIEDHYWSGNDLNLNMSMMAGDIEGYHDYNLVQDAGNTLLVTIRELEVYMNSSEENRFQTTIQDVNTSDFYAFTMTVRIDNTTIDYLYLTIDEGLVTIESHAGTDIVQSTNVLLSTLMDWAIYIGLIVIMILGLALAFRISRKKTKISKSQCNALASQQDMTCKEFLKDNKDYKLK